MTREHRSDPVRGIALVIVMVLLMVMSLLSISAARAVLQEAKATRNSHQHQVAVLAAEAALLDAESDIADSPDAVRSRSALFSPHSSAGFPDGEGPICVTPSTPSQRGLCRGPLGTERPGWMQIDLADHNSVVTVAYGEFTGRAMQTGLGGLPARLPRYLIELIPDRHEDGTTDPPIFLYRITAIGFGIDGNDQVVLQTLYRKGSTS